MNTLVIERSTSIQSVALIDENGVIESSLLKGADCRSGDWTLLVKEFLGDKVPSRILVGTGPGSFAGIRAALAFAQGYALGSKCEVVGLASACAQMCEENCAIVGDARRGQFWIALFKDGKLSREIFQVSKEELVKAIPSDYSVYSPDIDRIDKVLKEIFPVQYKGLSSFTAEGLAHYAIKNEGELIQEPLPLYLNPAVR